MWFSLDNHYASSLLTWFFLCPNYCHNINTHTHTCVCGHIHMTLMALSENRFLSFKFKALWWCQQFFYQKYLWASWDPFRISFSEIEKGNTFSRSQSPPSSVVKNLSANARDVDLIPGSGRSPGEGSNNPLQYSCLGHPMDRGARKATVHEVTKELDMT